MDDATLKDAFNLLCGDKIGSGASRDVFHCRLVPGMVVKVENTEHRTFQNVRECQFWDDHEHFKKVSDWLAPCHFMSPDGRILIQSAVTPIHDDKDFPDKLPAFLTDTKRSNFGWYKGRVVCCDYGITIPNPSLRMRKADWWDD